MTYELIITEKPSAAQKIAEALADKKALKKNKDGVPYYEITHNNQPIVVACAVGHLFTVIEKEKNGYQYPSFSITWGPSYEQSESSAFTKKYVKALKALTKDATAFTVATDYDIEGEVIGFNVVKHICKQKDACRMKFSTLTKQDLVDAYAKKTKTLDWGQVHAGVTRHEIDWLYGINLSRALTQAIKAGGTYKTLSSGRVQGPALKLVVDKELEIKAFTPEPYWQIFLKGTLKDFAIEAVHKQEKFNDEQQAKTIYDKTKGKPATVEDVQRKEFTQAPPHPFDLTSLQVECYRVHHIQPKITLSLAQDLYTGGFISYPRTSSQKLPAALGYKKLLEALKRNEVYKELVQTLLEQKTLKPNEGKKTDDAHPAIYPTGIIPDKLNEQQQKLYDLIVRRFLATFAPPAVRETMTVIFDVQQEPFLCKGTRTVKKGWHTFYGSYATFDEVIMPDIVQKDVLQDPNITLEKKETKPPKRFTQASIIKELEKRNLGTKATRATIIDNLYDRGYLKEKSIEATDLGIKTCATLQKYSPLILDEQMTRTIEEEMEKIRQKELDAQQVIVAEEKKLKEILEDFKQKEQHIGKELKEAFYDTANKDAMTVGCPSCKKGTLLIKKGKFGRFLACNQYPECSYTVSMPKTGKLKASGKQCEACGNELLSIQLPKKAPQLVCIN
ncbi:MAG: DNA topoisomerase I, partial [Candidatus Woesearchaeota archaeon]